MKIKAPDSAFYNRLIQSLDKIDNARDLKRAGLTLASYRALYSLVAEAILHRETNTYMMDCVNWCRKHGFVVEEMDGVNYKISIPMNEEIGYIVEK